MKKINCLLVLLCTIFCLSTYAQAPQFHPTAFRDSGSRGEVKNFYVENATPATVPLVLTIGTNFKTVVEFCPGKNILTLRSQVYVIIEGIHVPLSGNDLSGVTKLPINQYETRFVACDILIIEISPSLTHATMQLIFEDQDRDDIVSITFPVIFSH